MSKKPKAPQAIFYLGIFREVIVEEGGAVWKGNELIDPRFDIGLAEFQRALKKPSDRVWTKIMQSVWEGTSSANGYHLPHNVFQVDDIDNGLVLSMTYPIVLTENMAHFVNTTRDVMEQYRGSEAIKAAMGMVTSVEQFLHDPFITFYAEIQRQIDALEIPKVIPFGRSELDEMKTFIVPGA